MSDLSDLSDLSDKVGAPVFALTGYAVASHVIPRGFACRCVVWLGRKFTAGENNVPGDCVRQSQSRAIGDF